jgi:hypothetical protein
MVLRMRVALEERIWVGGISVREHERYMDNVEYSARQEDVQFSTWSKHTV